jgi:hypothetical protein
VSIADQCRRQWTCVSVSDSLSDDDDDNDDDCMMCSVHCSRADDIQTEQESAEEVEAKRRRKLQVQL